MTRTLLFALALIACGGEKGSDTADTGASAAPTPAGTGSGGTGTGSGGTASGWTAGTGTGTGTGMGSAGTGTGTGSAGTGTGSTGTGTGSTGTGTGTGATGTGTGSTPVDADGDGYAAPDDCDDTDDTVFPGAAESCDLVDSDCDGDLVEGFDDLDGDHTPDCVDADPCTPAPDDLVVWFRGDFDLIDSMGTSWLDDAYSYGGLFTGGVVGGAFDLEPSWYALDWDADPWLVSPIAIEAWVKTTPASADPWGAVPHQTVLAHYECAGPCAVGPSGLSPSLYILRVNAAGHAEFLIRDADAGHGVPTDVVEGATDLTDDRWHHLLAVLDADAGSLQLYVDGVPDADPHALVHNDGSGFAQDDAWDTDPITIGFQGEASTGMPVHLWRGAIDELSVYAGALTADDAADLYMAGIAGKCR